MSAHSRDEDDQETQAHVIPQPVERMQQSSPALMYQRLAHKELEEGAIVLWVKGQVPSVKTQWMIICATEAVRNREVPACPICLEYPINPGFDFCSKKCALKAEDSDGGPLKRLDQQGPSAYEAVRRFMTSWQSPPSEQLYRPSIHVVYDIDLPKKYEKRERGGGFGGFTITTTYYGGQMLCDLGSDGALFPKLCNWPGCSICIVVTKAFDVLEFGAADNDGPFGRGIYTHRNPAVAHLKTVGKSTNPFRAIIACSVVAPTSNSRPDKKHPIIMDESGEV
ncbi:hypothetical protein FRB97_004375, partial [Tulasnella sp. 331]